MDIRQPRLGIPSRGFLIDYTIPATSLLPCCKKRKTLAIYNSIPIGIHRSSMSKKQLCPMRRFSSGCAQPRWKKQLGRSAAKYAKSSTPNDGTSRRITLSEPNCAHATLRTKSTIRSLLIAESSSARQSALLVHPSCLQSAHKYRGRVSRQTDVFPA